MFQLGVHVIISIIIYLIAIGLSFQAVKAIQLDKIIRKGHVFETQLLYLFIYCNWLRLFSWQFCHYFYRYFNAIE